MEFLSPFSHIEMFIEILYMTRLLPHIKIIIENPLEHIFLIFFSNIKIYLDRNDY